MQLASCLIFHVLGGLPGFIYIGSFLKSPTVSFFLDIRIMYLVLTFTLKGWSVFSLPDLMTVTFAVPTLTSYPLLLLCFPYTALHLKCQDPWAGKPFHPSLEGVGGARIYNMLPFDMTVRWQPRRRVWHNHPNASVFNQLVMTPFGAFGWGSKRQWCQENVWRCIICMSHPSGIS